MLILTRKPGESIVIGEDVRITVLAIRGNQIKLGIAAPSEVRVNREEVLERDPEHRRQAPSDQRSPGAGERGQRPVRFEPRHEPERFERRSHGRRPVRRRRGGGRDAEAA